MISKENYFFVGIFFLTGIFVTMPILTINIDQQMLSIFTIAFIFFYVIVIWKNIILRFGFNASLEFELLISWFVLCLISSVVGITYFYSSSEWLSQVLGYIPKIILYLILLICIANVNQKINLMSFFLKGFIFGSVLNLIWAIFEGVSFYYFEVTLNNIVFSEYVKTLPVDRQYITVVMDGIIRASGFNTDPAHLGGLIPIVILYSLYRKNIFLFVLALAALIFSGSTTALVASLLSLAISPWQFQHRRISMKKFVGSFVILSILFTSVLVNEQIREGILNNIQGFYDRIFENYVQKHDSGPRYIYHAYLPEAIQYNGVRTLLGTGFGTASHPYVDNPEIVGILNQGHFPYDPESTYISYLFDVGIFGLILYFFTLISLIRKFRNQVYCNVDNMIIYVSLSGIFFSGFFYHYTLTAYQILIIIFAVASVNKNKYVENS